MPQDNQGPEDLLIDLHLDRLDERVGTWLKAELARDPDLRAKSDRLGKLLRPLDHWTVTAAPLHLADRVLRQIEQAASVAPTLQSAGDGVEGFSQRPIAPEADFRQRGLPSLREVIAIAACLAALLSVIGPGLSEVRARSHRAACASNLGSIFRGTTLYQQAFAGSLPFAGRIPGAAWLPNAASDNAYQSNSRHIYLIAKLNYGPEPKDFVCPACGDDKPMGADELAGYDDFAATCNISYASLNMCGPRPNLRPPEAIAYMGDPSPLFVDARFDASVDPNRTNSPAHKGKCQRVLLLDGCVTRLTSPVYGPKRDNLWLAGTIRRYVGTETPIDNNDAFLIPGFPETDPIILGRWAK